MSLALLAEFCRLANRWQVFYIGAWHACAIPHHLKLQLQ
jgi:hypothetical protein